jgi:hypothetical protein
MRASGCISIEDVPSNRARLNSRRTFPSPTRKVALAIPRRHGVGENAQDLAEDELQNGHIIEQTLDELRTGRFIREEATDA